MLEQIESTYSSRFRSSLHHPTSIQRDEHKIMNNTSLKIITRRHNNQLQKLDHDLQEMNNRIIKITKWQRFKSHREMIIDNYIRIKRK